MKMADEQGLETLSMRNLAAELSVQAMSLYNHVANKDDIIDALVDLVVADIELPQPGLAWQKAMEQRAQSMYAVLTRHPWATLTLVSRITVGPARLRFMESTLACLAGAGFSLPAADHVMNAFDSFTYGFVLQELKMPIRQEDYSSAANHFLAGIDTVAYPHFAALSQQVIDRNYNGLNRLDYGLAWLTAGLLQLGLPDKL